MKLSVYDDSGEQRDYHITPESYKKCEDDRVVFVSKGTKESNLLKLIEVFYSGKKAILYDANSKQIEQRLELLDADKLFSEYDFSFIYFTSGTSGSPIGALKTDKNILSELKQLSLILSAYQIKKVVVTVPFIHFYGSLLGAFFALENDIDIVIKEHFLPNDLLNMCDERSMIVTTPLYIKSLSRLGVSKDLSSSLFVSSTAPLFPEVSKEFRERFGADIIQIFGSTETGGIAYKKNEEELWTPFKSVDVSQNKKGEMIVVSPFVSNVVFEDSIKVTNGTFETFDFIEIEEGGFRLVGRSSQIIKLAGKRYSTVRMENLLEADERIEKAVVSVSVNKKALRGEELDITIQTRKPITLKELKAILEKEFANMRFAINLNVVESIKTTSVGKKMLIQ